MSRSSTAVGSAKVIGANRQVSLGTQFAGRQVLVEEPGAWLIRTATVMPDNQRWLRQPRASGDLNKALAWAAANLPTDDDEGTGLTELE